MMTRWILLLFLISGPIYTQEVARYGLGKIQGLNNIDVLAGRFVWKTAADPFGGYWQADRTTEIGLPVTAGALQTNRVREDCPSPTAFSDPCPDVYLTHVTIAGVLDYASYVGTPTGDTPVDLQVDSKGNAILIVQHLYFNSLQSTLEPLPDPAQRSAFMSILKFAVDGSGLIFSRGMGAFNLPLALDSKDNIYLTGRFPDLYPTKLDPVRGMGGMSKVATGEVAIQRMAVSTNGDVFLAGSTSSLSATQPLLYYARYNALPGQSPSDIAFVGRVTEASTRIDRVAVLGRGTGALPWALIVARNGDVVVGGRFSGDPFSSTPGAAGTPRSGESDAFLMRLSPDLEQERFRIVAGGEAADMGTFLFEERSGDLMLIGNTTSQLFPQSEGAAEQCAAENRSQDQSHFLVVAKADGSEILYSSYLPQAQGYSVFPLRDGRVAFGYTTKTLGFATYGLPDFEYPSEGPRGGYAVIDRNAALPKAQLCAVNSASFARNGAAHESLLTLFGSHFGPREGIGAEPSVGVPYPTELGGVSVTLNGKPASLIFVNHRQINLVLPRDASFPLQIAVLSPSGTQSLRLEQGPVSFGMFGMFGERAAAAINQDGTRNRLFFPIIQPFPDRWSRFSLTAWEERIHPHRTTAAWARTTTSSRRR
ncbi:MAG: hypothetical protein U5J83_08120 [Bryobacterales bacterium]|nr:hypothetical protein [Bryobacterales bacterium]